MLEHNAQMHVICSSWAIIHYSQDDSAGWRNENRWFKSTSLKNEHLRITDYPFLNIIFTFQQPQPMSTPTSSKIVIQSVWPYDEFSAANGCLVWKYVWIILCHHFIELDSYEQVQYVLLHCKWCNIHRSVSIRIFSYLYYGLRYKYTIK